MSEFVFVLPGDLERPTGGNIYGRELTQALRRAGAPVRVLDLAGARPFTAAFPGVPLWLDSLYYAQAAALPAPLWLIVHYFPSLSSELAEPERVLAWQMEQQAFQVARGFLATSEYSRELLAGRGWGAKPCLVVPPALSFPAMVTHAPADRLRALMVAGLTPDKGVRELLEALAALAGREADFQLEVVGRTDLDPEYAESCTRLVAQHPFLRARVRMLGELRGDRLRRSFGRSNLFVSASGHESYGMALAEARACGLPILALAAGNVAEHARAEEGGRLLPSLAALAGAILALARDLEQLAALMAEARSSRPRVIHTWDDAAREFLRQAEGTAP